MQLERIRWGKYISNVSTIFENIDFLACILGCSLSIPKLYFCSRVSNTTLAFTFLRRIDALTHCVSYREEGRQ